MNKFFDFWDAVSFFILGGDKECSGPKKLKIFFTDLFFHQILIEDHDNSEESFREHLEPEMEVDNPVEKNAPHVRLDFLLLGHVIDEIVLLGFEGEHVTDASLKIVRDHLDVGKIGWLGGLFFGLEID